LESDFDLLSNFVVSADSVIVTPNTLTETSNLLRQTDEPARTQIFEQFRRVIQSADERYIESKREVYKLHGHCKYILTIQQDRIEVRADVCTEAGWQDEVLNKREDLLVLADFGLRCALSDLYRRTSLAPRRASS